MSDRMPDDQFDRALGRFLAWQAEDIGDTPTATEMAARISSRVGGPAQRLRLTPMLGWALLAGLLIAALIGALIGAGMQTRETPVPLSYEAVFLRLEVVDGTPVVIVVGVNTDGGERRIARLPGAWVAFEVSAGGGNRAFLSPMGAVSPTGLLAIPRGGADLMMRWEIFDLRRPQAAPLVVAGIEQFVDTLRSTPYFEVNSRGGVSWGPGERLAILWYEQCVTSCVPDVQATFVEGRTGAATTVDLPADLVALPYWASDGSGVFVGDNNPASDPQARVAPQLLLRPDGTVAGSQAVAEASCRTRYQTGAEISVSSGRIVRRNPDGTSDELPTPGGVLMPCLAPDDSAIAHIQERPSGITAEGTTSRPAGLIATGSGAWFEIEGSFAGWMEVTP